MLSPAQFDVILQAIFTHFSVASDAEISTEANPNDLSEAYLKDLRHLNFNRLSIGMQTAIEAELNLFARRHDNQTVLQAFEFARQAGFDNINLDLIYGFPHQTIETWQKSLSQIISLSPEHISLYALGLEDGTPLKSWVEKGKLPTPDDDLAADMYELATDVFRADYAQYEISNWAKPGYACRHNVQYWRNEPYIGLGPGAHGFANGVRYSTVLSPQRYIKALQTETPVPDDFPLTPAVDQHIVVDQENEIAETLITNLRLLQEGVQREQFLNRFGIDLLSLYGELFKRFEAQDLLKITPEQVLLTEKGRLLSNIIFRELV